MKFVSTRGDTKFSFKDAILNGKAPDGGLYLPEYPPIVERSEFVNWSNFAKENNFDTKIVYKKIALDILSKFIDQEEIPQDDLKQIIEKSFYFPITFSHLSKDQRETRGQKGDWEIMELFNGPTFTFKDIGLQFLGNLLSYFISKEENPQKITIIVATSGDTGSSAIKAIEASDWLDIYVLYPGFNRISELQERQMATSQSKNVHCVRMDGTSDDGDVVIHYLFSNQSFREKMRLTTLNSINIARILVQICHFFFSYIHHYADEIIHLDSTAPLPLIRYAIPSGGLGNSTSCFVAKKMNLPISKLVLGVNENNCLHNLFNNGFFETTPISVSIAPAIDISNPYNIERYIYYIFNQNYERIKQWMEDTNTKAYLNEEDLVELNSFATVFKISSEEIVEKIKEFYSSFGYFLDPHTAVGVAALVRKLETEPDGDYIPTICLATAHPAKFPETIEKTVSAQVPIPDSLKSLYELPLRFIDFPASEMASWGEKLLKIMEENYA